MSLKLDLSDLDFSSKGDHEFQDDGFGFCSICIERKTRMERK
jgi:hypothetical protein